eukprot:TRINITY_DN21548_c0_g1_i1.p2 TRINITY_DN21548_c0_g1~~TRINITY_DN21548_c0_g1_i1.p2  ORF type:complete len:116 (-),score=3.26 TRINITY_DN21548_c0_g1_i1:140-487(-)
MCTLSEEAGALRCRLSEQPFVVMAAAHLASTISDTHKRETKAAERATERQKGDGKQNRRTEGIRGNKKTNQKRARFVTQSALLLLLFFLRISGFHKKGGVVGGGGTLAGVRGGQA